MKGTVQMNRWRRDILPIFIVLGFAQARADAPPTPPGLMTIARLEGAATGIAPGGDREQPLVAGEKLSEGTTVATAAASRMEIVFGSGTIVRVGENTRLELREAPTSGNRFHARLLLGNFWAHVHKLIAGESFELETENAVAGVRGTEFRVEVKAGEPDLLRVYEGVVQVDGKLSTFTHRIQPGRELRFGKQAPAGPQEFATASEADHPFVKWVNQRKESDLKRKDREKNKKDKRDRKDGVRDRLRNFQRKE